MNNNHIIFDLDGTVIDSSHRTTKALVDGKFCLATYFKDCNTDDLIMEDSLLPLAVYMQSLAKQGITYSIITARTLRSVDHQFLWFNKLINLNTLIFDRSSVHPSIRSLSDADYKVYQLNRLKCAHPFTRFVMFDDHPHVVATLNMEDNIIVLDAIPLNKALAVLTGASFDTPTKALDLSSVVRSPILANLVSA